jgi:hypothetical protein
MLLRDYLRNAFLVFLHRLHKMFFVPKFFVYRHRMFGCMYMENFISEFFKILKFDFLCILF